MNGAPGATPFGIRPFSGEEEGAAGARLTASTDPRITLGRDEAACRRALRGEGKESYGAFAFGTALLAFAEERIFRDGPNVFICVSSFNAGARRLYERFGYSLVGELTDYLVPGHSEHLLRKTIAPIGSFRRPSA